MNSANRDFVLRHLLTKLFVTLSVGQFNSYEACLIWKYNPMIYFWVNWSTIDSLNHLFNVPLVFCQKSSFGRFLIFWFHSFGNWYPLAFLFNWALYYCFEFLYALVLKIICILENYCVTFMLYRIDSYRHMYILLFRICFRYVPIPVSFLWTLNSSNLLIELSYMWLLGFHMCPCFQFLSNLNILVKDYCLLRIDS